MRRGITRKLARSRHSTPLFRELTWRARLRDFARSRVKLISARQFKGAHERCVKAAPPFTRVRACSRAISRVSTLSAYKKHEDEKKRTYGQRILEIEHGVFTPLVLSTSGGMGREAQTFYKRLADLLSLKRDVPYCSLMGWLRCKLSFATLRSAVMCIRGSRSSRHHVVRDSSDTVLVCAEGRVPLET